jgi:peptidoglycan/LPS O-acetylase OafA/YrhL
MTDRAMASQRKPTPEQIRAFLAKRDLAIDFVRISCVLLVVALHSLMVGINTSHGIQVLNPVQGRPEEPYLSWVLQVMPLFFIVGGFASWQRWQGIRRKQLPTTEFFRARVLRLVYPALAWFIAIGAGVWLALLLGAPAELVQAFAVGVAEPLWFLVAYLVTQFAVPFTIRLHERAPYLTPALLLVGVIGVDMLRFTTGITNLGFLNMPFVWLLLQQLGFLYAAGKLQQLPRRALPGIILAALVVVAFLGYAKDIFGWSRGYAVDMMVNLNPPTLPLVVIGIMHLALLLWVKPRLDTLMQRARMQRLIVFLGARAMTIYLWHLAFVILVAALPLLLPLPQPGSGGWWLLRLPTLALIYALVIGFSLFAVRFERGPKIALGAAPAWGTTVLIALLALVPPVFAMLERLNMNVYLWGSLMLLAAIVLAIGPHRRARTKHEPQLTPPSPTHR